MVTKIILFLISLVHLGSCIRCYDCNSVNNSMCLEPELYDSDTLHRYLPVVECRHGVQAPSEEFFCRKIHQTILHKHYEPEVRVMRGCGWRRHYRECYKADNEDHLETVCQCQGDLCNAAPPARARRHLAPAAACAAILAVARTWRGI